MTGEGGKRPRGEFCGDVVGDVVGDDKGLVDGDDRGDCGKADSE